MAPTPRFILGQSDQIFECCENSTYCAKLGKAGLTCTRWFPIVFVFVMLISSIYFFSVRLCIDFLIYGNIPRVTQGALYICAYWILFLFVTFSFIRAAFGDPQSPNQFKIKITVTQAEEVAAFTDDQYKELKKDQVVYLPRSTARMCGICNAPKPPRTHHCSTCQRCFLKMDHHCVWLDNCVGYGNYKFFFCLLFWATFMCGFIFGATLEVLIQQLVYNDLQGVSVIWLVMTILSFALGLSTLMLLVYHSFLISKGMTTIEHIEISEEREDFKRRERIRLRELENISLRVVNNDNSVNTNTNKNPDYASSSTNLLTNANTSFNNNNNNNNNNNTTNNNNNNNTNTATTNNNTNTTNNHTISNQQVQLNNQALTNPKFSYQNYSEGFYKNWCAALGKNPLLWLIPVNLPTGNGIRFKKEEATVARRICI